MMQFCSQEVVFDKLGFHLPLTTGWLPLFSAHLLSFQASTFGITNRRFIWEKLVQCCRSCCCCCRIANWRFRHSTVLPVFLRLIYWLYYTNNYRPIVPIKSPATQTEASEHFSPSTILQNVFSQWFTGLMLQGVKELLRLADRCRKQCLLLLIFYDFFVRFLGLHSCLKNSSFKSKNVHLFPLKLSIRRSFPNSKPMKSTILADFMILSNLEIPVLSRWTKDLLHKQKCAPFLYWNRNSTKNGTLLG